MATPENDVTWVEPPQLTLLERLYVPSIVSGMVTTAKHIARTLAGKELTVQFPEERPSCRPITAAFIGSTAMKRAGSAAWPATCARPFVRPTASTSSLPHRRGLIAKSIRKHL